MSGKQSKTPILWCNPWGRYATGFWRKVANEDVHSEFTAAGIEPRTSGALLFTAPDALVQSAPDPQLCWIQFYCLVKEAAYIATAILVPCVFLFVWFAVKFYQKPGRAYV